MSKVQNSVPFLSKEISKQNSVKLIHYFFHLTSFFKSRLLPPLTIFKYYHLDTVSMTTSLFSDNLETTDFFRLIISSVKLHLTTTDDVDIGKHAISLDTGGILDTVQ